MRFSQGDPLAFTWLELNQWNQLHGNLASAFQLEILMKMSQQWRIAMIDEIAYSNAVNQDG